MAAQQNVVTALYGGPVALLAAVGAVLVCGATIALISRSHRGEPLPALEPTPETRAQVAPAGGR